MNFCVSFFIQLNKSHGFFVFFSLIDENRQHVNMCNTCPFIYSDPCEKVPVLWVFNFFFVFFSLSLFFNVRICFKCERATCVSVVYVCCT